ncbi:MAG: biopolymer transporter ExbD [Pseudohongiellaceae bacterium]|nr:biopolymer transporter ExbD [Pseudohongiellaceae bacterium]
MKFQRRIQDELQINLTPLIDVVFLLLIFFMVTTTFTRESRLAVNLPEADGEPAQEVPQQIEISVGRDGGYAIDGRTLVNSELDTLIRGLEEVAAGNLDVSLVLVADAEATHQSVVRAMDAIGQSGFSRLSIATRRPDEDN